MSDKHYVVLVMVILVAQTTKWLKQGTKWKAVSNAILIKCFHVMLHRCAIDQTYIWAGIQVE